MKTRNPNPESMSFRTFSSLLLTMLVTLSLVTAPVAAVGSKTDRSAQDKAPSVSTVESLPGEASKPSEPMDNLTVFSNPATINVPDNTASSAQSNISVAGLVGPVSSVTVTLNGFSAPSPATADDIDMLLVGPGGQKFLFFSDVGPPFTSAPGPLNFTLSDAAAGFLPNASPLVSGTFRPTNYEAAGDVFNPPAPVGPYLTAGPAGAGATFTSAFGGLSGASVNGTWSLFIEDDSSSAGTMVTINGGWSIDIITTAAAATTTVIGSSLNPSNTNQAVTFTSTTTSTSTVNTGNVNFVDLTTSVTLCSNVPVNGSGVATCLAPANTLTERIHNIQATYIGNATFATSNANLNQTVNFPTSQVGNTFTNGGGISIPDAGSGTSIPYPSNIIVSGLTGSISKVTLTLTNINFPSTNDHNFLLVGPNGDRYVFWSDAGGSVATSGQTVTLDDAAPTQLPNSGSIATGTYRPADYAVDSETWPAPAPAGPYNQAPPAGGATFASVYGGDAPNGTWSLFPIDDTGTANTASIGSWSLTFTTTGDAATTTVVTANPNPATTAQPVTFTATVTSGVTPVTVGTVTFRIGASILCANVALNASGQATCNQPAFTQGDRTITADYNGFPGQFNISSGNVVLQVNSPTIKTGNNFANNGGITIPNSSVANPYPSRIIVTGIGGTVTKVTLSLNGINAPNPDHLDFLLVGPGGQTFVFMGDAGGTTSVSGVNLTLDDAAASPLPDGGPLVSGTFRPASYVDDSDIFPAPAPAGPYGQAAPQGATTFALYNGISPLGTWSLYAVEDTGDALNTSLTGWSLTFTLAPAATTTSVTSSADPSVFGQPVTFTATVSTAGLGTPTGNVQFLDNGNPIGGAIALNASGQAQVTTSSLTVGNHTITANYAGDVPSGFNASTGSLVSNPQTVNQASTTTVITSNQANPVGTNIPVTYTATVNPVAPGAGTRTGTVTFSRNGSPVSSCTNVAINASAQATCLLSFTIAGNYNITAAYSGDTNFTTSNSLTFVQQVVGPTAANVGVSGRVVNGAGRGISGVILAMQNQEGVVVYATTNPFGYYRFSNVAVGQTYLVSATHKWYAFQPRTVSVQDELNDFNFVAEPASRQDGGIKGSKRPDDSNP